MSFPLRLTAELTFALASRAFVRGDGSPPLLYLSADTQFDPVFDSFPRNTSPGEEKSSQLPAVPPRRRSPAVWIGGLEPLDSPGVARLCNSICASGRHVFLETSGGSLKPRLHEFQPSSRFSFVIRFDTCPASLSARTDSAAAFCQGLEALRMARLAGFFTCANLIFHQDTPAGAIEDLHSEIGKLDIDGFLISPSAPVIEIQVKVRQACRRLLDRRWAFLSSLLDSAASQTPSRTSPNSGCQRFRDAQPDGFGEGAEAG